ncbi:MAG: HAMP domain-containing sensor histidine kinase, partial [bacterium]
LISVRDTGPGIPAEHCEKVFDRYFRVPGQSPSTGTGIGLSIVREIVKRHGGHVWVDSPEGLGAQFSLVLPVSQKSAGVGEVPGDNREATS